MFIINLRLLVLHSASRKYIAIIYLTAELTRPKDKSIHRHSVSFLTSFHTAGSPPRSLQLWPFCCRGAEGEALPAPQPLGLVSSGGPGGRSAAPAGGCPGARGAAGGGDTPALGSTGKGRRLRGVDRPSPENGKPWPHSSSSRGTHSRARPRPALPTGPFSPAPGPAGPAAAHCGSALSSWRRGAMCRTPTTGACGPSTVRTPRPPGPAAPARPAAAASRGRPGSPGNGAEGPGGRPGPASAGWLAGRPLRWGPAPAVGEPRAPLGGVRPLPAEPVRSCRGERARPTPRLEAGVWPGRGTRARFPPRVLPWAPPGTPGRGGSGERSRSLAGPRSGGRGVCASFSPPR